MTNRSSPVTELEALADELLSLSDVEQSFGRNYNRDVMRRAQVALRRHAQTTISPEYADAANIAYMHGHHALWHGLLDYGWDEKTEKFGRGLAYRISDAIKSKIKSSAVTSTQAPAQCAPGVKMSEVELARHFLRIVVSDRNDQADVLDSARDFLAKFDVRPKAPAVTRPDGGDVGGAQ